MRVSTGSPRRDGVRGPVLVLLHRVHEVIGDADGVVGVLEEDRCVRLSPVEVPVVPGVDQRPGLLLLGQLAVDELLDIGMADVEDHHLRGSSGLATGLDDAGEGVEALHEAHRAARLAAAAQGLLGAADGGEVAAGARAELEEHALGLGQGQDALHGVVHGVDEAGGALRVRVDAHVEPDGAVEGGALLEEDVLELVAEGLGVLIGREVGVLDPPVGDRVGDAVDHLLDAALALGRAEVAAEVLAGHDVGGQGRPALGELEVLLLEHGLAVLVGDGGFSQVPLDRVIRVDVGAGESALDLEALPAGLLALGQLDVAAVRLRLGTVPVSVGGVAVGSVAVAVAVGGGLGGGGGSSHDCDESLCVLRPIEGTHGWSFRGSGAVPPAVRRLAVRRVFSDEDCNTRPWASQAQNHNIWW